MMRTFVATFALSSVLFTLQATALPRPLADDSADTSAISDGTTTSPGIANPFPDAGQGTVSSDSLVASAASSGQPAASSDGSVVSSSPNGQVAGQSSTAATYTPLTPDNASAEGSASINQASTAAVKSQVDAPVELTGQLLGMPQCKGIYYNPKWDTCDEAIGSLKSKAGLHGKRLVANSVSVAGRHEVRRQASEDAEKTASQEKNPTILNGLAGVDDGAEPRKQNSPPSVKRQPSAEKAPGNIDFWNTPFEPNQEHSPRSIIKNKRQSLATGHLLKSRNGPLTGEDQVLDGSRPYPISLGDEVKRQSDDDDSYVNAVGAQPHGSAQNLPQSRVGVQGPESARNYISKRQNNASNSNGNPPGYLAALGNSHSGLNLEDPSVDPATFPRPTKNKRGQSDLGSASANSKEKPRLLSRDSLIKFKMSKRQVNNASHNQASDHSDPTGYLAALGNAATAGALNTAGLPKVKQAREEVGQPNFNPAVPHRDGNHVEVGPPGPGGARNIIINRYALYDAENPTIKPRTQITGSSHQADAKFDSRGVSTNRKPNNLREDADGKLVSTQAKRWESKGTTTKRSLVQEDIGGKLIVTEAKRGETDGMASRRAEVIEDTNGKFIVHQTKQHESEDVADASLPVTREMIVKKDNMAQYRHEIPSQEKWFQFGPDYESESESGSGIEAWWGD